MTDSASMRALRAGIALCLSGLVAACGGGGDGENAGTTATTPAPVQVTTPAPAPATPAPVAVADTPASAPGHTGRRCRGCELRLERCGGHPGRSDAARQRLACRGGGVRHNGVCRHGSAGLEQPAVAGGQRALQRHGAKQLLLTHQPGRKNHGAAGGGHRLHLQGPGREHRGGAIHGGERHHRLDQQPRPLRRT